MSPVWVCLNELFLILHDFWTWHLFWKQSFISQQYSRWLQTIIVCDTTSTPDLAMLEMFCCVGSNSTRPDSATLTLWIVTFKLMGCSQSKVSICGSTSPTEWKTKQVPPSYYRLWFLSVPFNVPESGWLINYWLAPLMTLVTWCPCTYGIVYCMDAVI